MSALQRNMNGEEPSKVQALITFWRSRLGAGAVARSDLRNPVSVLRESLAEQANSERPISRYKLLIDTTKDDSILRALRARHDLDANAYTNHPIILKLSDFPEDTGLQQVTLVSSVKYAAEQGGMVVLSHTERVNENFYDLFNQHFQRHEDYDRISGQMTVSYHANIAVGSDSKLCCVSKGFQCIVHLRLTELIEAPAPFLHRMKL